MKYKNYIIVLVILGFISYVSYKSLHVVPPETDISVPEKIQGEVGKLSKIKINTASQLIWWVPPKQKLDVEVFNNTAFIIPQENGEYYIAVSVKCNNPQWIVITVGSKPPVPIPGPVPGPTTKLWIIIIHDPSTDTQEFGRIITSVTLREKLKNNYLRVYTKTHKTVTDDGYDKYLDKGIPCIILMEPSGKLRIYDKLPDSEDKIFELVKKAGGL